MKKLFSLLLIIVMLWGCNQNNSSSISNFAPTTMKVENPIRHYYPINLGAKLYTTFKFFNTGKAPLKIQEVQTSCGCIVAEYTTSIIAPGGFGFINITFDSNKSLGHVESYIDVYANLKQKQTLLFDVNVVPSSDYIRDYEEIYNQTVLLKEKIDGKPTERGYYTDDSSELRW
jgi:hypothetical protein